jgi:2-haloacid dehalogenase
MIKYIFLDLDDTILDFPWAEGQAIRRTLLDFDIEPTEEICQLYHSLNWECWQRLERKEITREDLKVIRFQRLQEEMHIEGDPVAFAETYIGHLSQGHCFLPGAEETLRALQKDYRLFLATNGFPRVQYGRLDSAGIRDCFEKIFISQELDAYKPYREFFDRCFAQIPGFDPTQALMVGDSLNSDMKGGINAGIKTCWVNPHHRPERDGIHPDYQIDTLPELLPILAQI